MKLRKVIDGSGEEHYAFYCLGCQSVHFFGPTWKFNGNMNSPTFSPSLICYVPEDTDEETGEVTPRETLCHLFLVDGKIKYLDDCPHDCRNKTIDLPEIPSNWEFND